MLRSRGFMFRMALIGAVLGGVVTTTAADGSTGALAAPPPASASVFTPIAPQRLVDSREGLGVPRARLAAGAAINIQVTGRLNIPQSATAAMVNVTAVAASGPGYLQVLPTGRAALGSASTLNIDQAAQTIPNAAFAPLAEGGQLTVFSTFATDLVIDVSGYFTPASSSTSGRLIPLTPTRILDTRIALGYTPPTPPPTTQPPVTNPPPTNPPPTNPPQPGNPGDTKNCSDFANYAEAKAWFDTYYPYYGDVAKLDQNNDLIPCESLRGAPRGIGRDEIVAGPSIIALQVSGRGGVPNSGVSAVVMNVTAVDPTGPGFVQVAPTPLTPGASSNLNTAAGITIANLVVVPLGTGGRIDLYHTMSADLLADVVGYFTDATAPDGNAGLFVPITPSRQLDSREPAPRGALASNTVTRVDLNDISADAIAIAGNLTGTENTLPGYVQVAAAPLTPGASSNLNMAYAGQTIANAVLTPVSQGQVEVLNSPPAHVLLDVTGWFTAASAPGSPQTAAAMLSSLTVTAEYTGPTVYNRDLFPH